MRSTKPLAQKLYIKEGMRLGLLGAPSHFVTLLGTLPKGVCFGENTPDHIQLFATTRKELETMLKKALPVKS